MMTDLSVYSSLCFCMLTLNWKTIVGGSSNILEAEKHLEIGRELTAKGQFSDALAHFDAAVESDPNNYLTYFRRATVYLALGKSKAALPDLDKVVQLKPDFTASWIQRGNILLKLGRIDEAHVNFEAVLRREPDNPEANLQYGIIEPLKRDLEMGHIFKEDRDYVGAIGAYSRAIEACPWNAELREARAECYLQSDQPMQAIFDWRTVTKLRSDSTGIHLRISRLLYDLGEGEDSLLEIRECLKLDPDHKDCFTHYKYIKKLVALMKAAQDFYGSEQFTDCITKAESVLKLEKQVLAYQFTAKHLLCQCQHKAGEPVAAIKTCTEALEMEENPNVLCHRAEAHIANDNFDEALQDFQRAHQVDGNSQCAQEGIRNTQKLKKQSQKRDYYKILGVKRTATKREVTKAYRKLAQQWHPDNFDEAEKKMAEKKFIDIAAAKEVLTDPEKRQKFDSGEDPLDPESHAGQGFNPFGQGFQFNQFRSDGPFQFRFNFN